MKEILQTKYLNLKSAIACAYSDMLAYSCIVHVEPVAQDYVAVEAEAAEVEVQEELQELEAAEQVEDQEFDLVNPDPQPGKHRKHLTQCHVHIFKFQSYLMLFTCALS